jgi:hypothetical protein
LNIEQASLTVTITGLEGDKATLQATVDEQAAEAINLQS